MRKRIDEEFSPLRNSSPYKVRRDKGFVQDATPQLNQRYLMQKAMEINNFYERQQMFGELDKLEPLFVDLFKQITYIKEFLVSQEKQPLINKRQRQSIKAISKKLDQINKVISSDVLDELDKLGAEKDEKEPDNITLSLKM
ncbi:MAG: hypothetical protein IKU15_00965 [Clostridia bacterium]|nr:hypothetical protein [Clostridia bacterium]